MTLLRNRPDRRFDESPPALVIEGPLHGFGDEATSSPRAYQSVEISNGFRAHRDVHSHGHMLAHYLAHSDQGSALGQLDRLAILPGGAAPAARIWRYSADQLSTGGSRRETVTTMEVLATR